MIRIFGRSSKADREIEANRLAIAKALREGLDGSINKEFYNVDISPPPMGTSPYDVLVEEIQAAD